VIGSSLQRDVRFTPKSGHGSGKPAARMRHANSSNPLTTVESAAFTEIAPLLGARQLQVLAKQIEQCGARINDDVVLAAIDEQRDRQMRTKFHELTDPAIFELFPPNGSRSPVGAKMGCQPHERFLRTIVQNMHGSFIVVSRQPCPNSR